MVLLSADARIMTWRELFAGGGVWQLAKVNLFCLFFGQARWPALRFLD